MYDTIIIGSGVVGLATGMYAGRLGLKTLIIGNVRGGTITLTDTIENYPGFKKLTGQELAKKIEEHAHEYNIQLENSHVESVSRSKRCFEVSTKDKSYKTKTVVFATGTKIRKLKVPGEAQFENRGVHTCAICDGPLYKNKLVGVIGGSDSAAKEAILLTSYAKKVYIIYRGKKIHPEPINMQRVEQLVKQGKIEIVNNTNVTEIRGKKLVTHIVLDKPYKKSKELKLNALFIEIGHIPLSELAKQLKVRTNKKGEITINRNSETNIQGVYAAGDVTDTEFKQAITGVAEGVQAAYHAYEYINKTEVSHT